MNAAEKNFQLLQEIESGRELLLMAYEQNPGLLKRAEPRVRALFQPQATLGESPLKREAPKQRGISLIELIIFIVITSVALTGILLVMNQVTRHSVDPLIHKQALAAAESLLEEIELQDFISQSGVTNAVTQANRTSEYHIVSDYNGFASTGIFAVSGAAAIAGLENYDASVTVTNEALNGIAAGSAVRITVTVTDPQGTAITMDGYRTAY
jgi:MSHA pilin protein MshD